MVTYEQISTKDDRLFHRVAKIVIGQEYGNACFEAEKAFNEGYKSGTVTTRINMARKAANLVILRWLRDFGVTDWTNIDAPKVNRQVVESGFVSKTVKDREFNSSDKLWSRKL